MWNKQKNRNCWLEISPNCFNCVFFFYNFLFVLVIFIATNFGCIRIMRASPKQLILNHVTSKHDHIWFLYWFWLQKWVGIDIDTNPRWWGIIEHLWKYFWKLRQRHAGDTTFKCNHSAFGRVAPLSTWHRDQVDRLFWLVYVDHEKSQFDR